LLEPEYRLIIKKEYAFLLHYSQIELGVQLKNNLPERRGFAAN